MANQKDLSFIKFEITRKGLYSLPENIYFARTIIFNLKILICFLIFHFAFFVFFLSNVLQGGAQNFLEPILLVRGAAHFLFLFLEPYRS